VHLVGFIIKKSLTMHGHMNVKYDSMFIFSFIMHYVNVMKK